jgi:hypothetical protein
MTLATNNGPVSLFNEQQIKVTLINTHCNNRDVGGKLLFDDNNTNTNNVNALSITKS